MGHFCCQQQYCCKEHLWQAHCWCGGPHCSLEELSSQHHNPKFYFGCDIDWKKGVPCQDWECQSFLCLLGKYQYYQLLQNPGRGAWKGFLICQVGCRVPSTAWSSMLLLALTSSWVTIHHLSKGILVLDSTTSIRNQNKCCSVFYLNLNGDAAFLHSVSVALLVW